MKETLYIVYNANGGLMNGMKDSLHKLISPSTYPCKLCEITHGYLSARKEWTAFIEELKDKGIGTKVLHKDELSALAFDFGELPGVYCLRDGQFSRIIEKESMNELESVEELINQIRPSLSTLSSRKGA